jgi:hypothetical protein
MAIRAAPIKVSVGTDGMEQKDYADSAPENELLGK